MLSDLPNLRLSYQASNKESTMLTAICFMFVAQGWRIAATMAYSVITLIIVLSLLLAWYDKRKLGDPEPLA